MSCIYQPNVLEITANKPLSFDPAQIAAMDALQVAEFLGYRTLICLCEPTPQPIAEKLGPHRYRCRHGEIHDLGRVREIHLILKVSSACDPLAEP